MTPSCQGESLGEEMTTYPKSRHPKEKEQKKPDVQAALSKPSGRRDTQPYIRSDRDLGTGRSQPGCLEQPEIGDHQAAIGVSDANVPQDRIPLTIQPGTNTFSLQRVSASFITTMAILWVRGRTHTLHGAGTMGPLINALRDPIDQPASVVGSDSPKPADDPTR
jgi:hypothetical protein